MSRRLMVAAAQLGPVQRDEARSQVVARMVALLDAAHRHRCALVVFPELALTTFFPRYLLDERALGQWFEPSMPNPDVQPLFDSARRFGIAFSIGYAERVADERTEHRFNTSVLVGADGRAIGKYRKVHLPGTVEPVAGAPFQHLEKRYFEVGDLGFQAWDALSSRIGMCICNDRRWPETFRVLALRGAEIVVLGYNTPSENIYHPEPAHLRMFHNEICLQAGAYQNALWVVASAKAGDEDGHRLIGGSCVVAPTGEIVARAAGEGDELVVHDCDLDAGAYLRRSVFDFARHRRIEHYQPITDQTGLEPR